MINIRIGDVLTRPKPGTPFTHVGVALGNGMAAHNTPDRGEHASSLEDFADGQPVTVHRTGADPSIVVARAQTVLASPQGYHAVVNNCEHTATKIIRGAARSSQAAFWFVVAIIIATVLLVVYTTRRQRA